jgi:cytochrome c553
MLLRRFAGFAGLMALVYAGAAAAAAPQAPKADLARGQQIATTVCAACHGANGVSVAPANPHLAGQDAWYIQRQLAAFKAGTRVNPIMQGMAAGLTPEDMLSVGAYYSQQKPAQGMARDKALADRGQKIWRAGVKATTVPACAGCHGAAGRGIAAQYPALAGQYPELLYSWLKAFSTGERAHEAMGLVASKMTEADMKAVAEYAAGLR